MFQLRAGGRELDGEEDPRRRAFSAEGTANASPSRGVALGVCEGPGALAAG